MYVGSVETLVRDKYMALLLPFSWLFHGRAARKQCALEMRSNVWLESIRTGSEFSLFLRRAKGTKIIIDGIYYRGYLHGSD